MRNCKRGVVLVWALVTMAVTTTILGAMGAYFVHSARIANVYMKQTEKRFDGQYALESVKGKIYSAMEAAGLMSATPGMSIATGSGFAANLEKAVSEIQNLLRNPMDVGNYTIVFEDANNSLEDIKQSGNGKMELTAKIYDKFGGGLQAGKPVMTLKEDIVFKTAGTTALTTLEIFDYVYFANNFGHLDNSVVANGEIGANDKFEIIGTRVNGYVNIRGKHEGDTSAYYVENAKMWPYRTYMQRVAKKIQIDMATLYPGLSMSDTELYTQIRPTNPVYVSDEEPPIEWDGGYEPPGLTSEFCDIAPSGDFTVSGTINDYADRLAMYEGGYTNAQYSTYFDTETGDAYANPLQAEHDTFYDAEGNPIGEKYADDYNKYFDVATGEAKSDPNPDYLKYYNADGSAKAYEGDYYKYYNANGSKKTNEYKTEYENYYELNFWGTKYVKSENPLQDDHDEYLKSDGSYRDYTDVAGERIQRSIIQSSFEKYYTMDANGNVTPKSNPYKTKVARKSWEDGKADFDGKYYDDYINWHTEQRKWGQGGSQLTEYATWNARQVTVQQDYDNWNTQQTALKDDLNNWNTNQNAAGIVHQQWESGRNAFLASGGKESYETWLSGESKWGAGGSSLAEYNTWNANQKSIGDDYDQWTADATKAQQDYDQWWRDFEAWTKSYLEGDEEVDLTKDTVHLSDKISKKIINVTTHFVEVPNLSDTNMPEYIEYCQNFTTNSSVGTKGGKLTCLNQYNTTKAYGVQMTLTNCYSRRVSTFKRTSITLDLHIDFDNFINNLEFHPPAESEEITPHIRTINQVKVTNGNGSDVIPITNPTESPFNEYLNLEKGSAILIGTAEYPITIDGPVYFPGDVVIRGVVRGQGTIYAGRNIHIVGDIVYENPPSWPHNNLTLDKNHPTKVAERNHGCDLLLLVARGNIIVGDYSTDLWQSDANMKFLRSYGNSSSDCNDFNESAIGYTRGFARDYTAKDGGNCVVVEYDERKGSPGIDWEDIINRKFSVTRSFTYTMKTSRGDRRYYESIFGDRVISELKQTITTDPDQLYKVPASFWRAIKNVAEDAVSLITTGKFKQRIVESRSPNNGDVMQIDSVLFANHGIFGVVGGEGAPQFTLNGALLCRDEGLLPSFSERFKAKDTAQKIWLNWDMRIKSDSAEGIVSTGAPMKVQNSGKSVDVYVDSWQQL